MKKILIALLCLRLCLMPVKAVPEEKFVALTFDDGPSGRFTTRLLDGLNQRNAKGTFLLCGYRMELYPELTERIVREGHEIGLHGYSHKSMDTLCSSQIRKELEKTQALLPEDCQVTFLRPPGGFCGSCVTKVAEDMGYAILSWSVDPKDWALHDADTVVNFVLRHVKDGDVILLHDMTDSSVDAALRIIDRLQKEHYRFVTVSELAALRGVALEPGACYTHFYLSERN